MKNNLYQKWILRNSELAAESLILEEEFRARGCSSCGPAKEGFGQWVLYGGQILICPHLKKFLNEKLRKKRKEQELLLSFIKSSLDLDTFLQNQGLVIVPTSPLKAGTNDRAVCMADNPE